MGGNGAVTATGGLKFRLSVMMFLEFFIWGAWLPLIFGYLPSLGFTAWEQSLILWTFNVSALVAMFFSNQFADRTFAAEKFLAFSQFVGGIAMMGLFWVKKPEGADHANFWMFFGLMLVHCLFYVPTISITNSIAFANLKDATHDFGPIRLWGTIGWIAAATPFIFLLIDWKNVPPMSDLGPLKWLGKALATPRTGPDYRQASSVAFIVSGAASLLLAGFSLALPHTPPKPSKSLAWVEALKLLGKGFVLVLFFVTFLDAMVHQLYFVWTERYLTGGGHLPIIDGVPIPGNYGIQIPGNWAPQIMTLGQVAEILTMAILGYVLKSLGWRWTMVIGILGHAARFSVFALFPQQVPSIAVILLHGICYAFFFATVYIFVDKFFPKDIRSSAQGLFNVLILGAGPFVGNYLGVLLGDIFKVGEYSEGGQAQPIINFHGLFLVPATLALVAALILVLFFHPPKEPTEVLDAAKA
jgi:nucleoside transporter